MKEHQKRRLYGRLKEAVAIALIFAMTVPTPGLAFTSGTVNNNSYIRASSGNITGSGYIGGQSHSVSSGTDGVAVAGQSNTITAPRAAAIGGRQNTISGGQNDANSVTIAGVHNTVNTDDGVAIGGQDNQVRGRNSIVIGGGYDVYSGNQRVAAYSGDNITWGGGSVIVSGQHNRASADASLILAGKYNVTTKPANGSVIMGGTLNTTYTSDVVVISGYSNSARGVGSTVVGGQLNVTRSSMSLVVGGSGNQTYGNLSLAVGGISNSTNGYNSLTVGGKENTTNDELAMAVGGTGNNAAAYNSITVGGTKNVTKGQQALALGGLNSRVEGTNAVALGGENNRTSGDSSLVAGGDGNWASGDKSMVLGGQDNEARANLSTVIGGKGNYANSLDAMVIGGEGNNANAEYSMVIGGMYNSADAQYATTIAGTKNTASAKNAITIGGSQLNATSSDAVAMGGTGNTVSASNAIAVGGRSNEAKGFYSATIAGKANKATDTGAVALGGKSNEAAGERALTAGGEGNVASGYEAMTLGGRLNTAASSYSVTVAGVNNKATSENAVVVGGRSNSAMALGAAVLGGASNDATGQRSLAAGGESNKAEGYQSMTLGGTNNIASSDYSVTIAGENNVADGHNAVTIGGNTLRALDRGAVAMGGTMNVAEASRSVVIGGEYNRTTGYESAVFGGDWNVASGDTAVAAGGKYNEANGDYSLAFGGQSNDSNGLYSVTIAGIYNKATSENAVAVGGRSNSAVALGSVAIGGKSNSATGTRSLTAAGEDNVASGYESMALGGSSNEARGAYSVTIAGMSNSASGENSVTIGGRNNRASETGAVVLGGGSNDAIGYRSVAAGGDNNWATGSESMALGGTLNYAIGSRSVTVGGIGNESMGIDSVTLGGQQNDAKGRIAVAISGMSNSARGQNSILIGGMDNQTFASTEEDVSPEGGNGSVIITGGSNEARGARSVIIAGKHNVTKASGDIIIGGMDNVADKQRAMVLNGDYNYASGYEAVVIGGESNDSTGTRSLVVGGYSNSATAENAVAVGGRNNTATDLGAVVMGGINNDSIGTRSLVAGGNDNTASGDEAIALGGTLNRSIGSRSVTIAGLENIASGENAVTIGGKELEAQEQGAVAIGGTLNTAVESRSVVIGGEHNTTTGFESAVFGGDWNEASGDTAVSVGGASNVSGAKYSLTLGGARNEANADGSMTAGGEQNVASGQNALVIGGYSNEAAGKNAVVIGGGGYKKTSGTFALLKAGDSDAESDWVPGNNIASGDGSTILSGVNNYTTTAAPNATTLGSSNYVNAEGGLAIGGATVYEQYGIAIGNQAVLNADAPRRANEDVISFGHVSGDTYWNGEELEKDTGAHYTRLINVADGSDDHDVVVIEQLKQFRPKSGDNITVVNDTASGVPIVNLNDNVVLSNAGSLTIGSPDYGTKLTFDGLFISRDNKMQSALSADTLTVGGHEYITPTSIDANDRKIENVAQGTQANHAAIVGQTVSSVDASNDKGVKGLSVWQAEDATDGSRIFKVGLSKDIDLGENGTISFGDKINNTYITSKSIKIGDTNISSGNVTVDDSILTTNSLVVDGRTYISSDGSINANNYKIINVAKGTNSTDVARMDQLMTLKRDSSNVHITSSEVDQTTGLRTYKISVDALEVSGDGNIYVDSTTNTIYLSKDIDMTEDGSIRFGDDIINNTYITSQSITVGDTHITSNNITLGGDGGSSITNNSLTIGGNTYISSDGTINANNHKIINVAPGETSTDVARMDQLMTLKRDSSNVHITSSEVDQTTGLRTYKISVDQYTASSDGNIIVNNTDHTIALSKDINMTEEGSIRFGDDTINNTYITSKSITVGDTHITSGNITVGDSSITNNSLTIGGNTYISSDGTINANNHKIINILPGTTSTDVATVGQTVSAVSADSSNVHVGMFRSTDGSKIYAISVDKYKAGKNIVISDDNTISLSKDVDLGSDGSLKFGEGITNITSQSVTVGNTSITSGNITVGGNTTITDGSVTVGSITISSDDSRIHGLEAGILSTDAVNVSQLKTAIASNTYYGDNKNIFVIDNTSGEHVITLSQDIDLGRDGSISFGSGDTYITDNSVNVGDTHITSGNVTIGSTNITSGNVTVGDTHIYGDNITLGNTIISKDGAKFGNVIISGDRIMNVAPGTSSFDVATVGQTVSAVSADSSNVHVGMFRSTDGSKIYAISVDQYTASSDGNIIVNNTDHTIALSKDINMTEEGSIRFGDDITNNTYITSKSITVGDTHITSGNITVGDSSITNNSLTIGGNTYISSDGTINANNHKIINILPGTTSTDVARMDQLITVKSGSTNVHINSIDEVDQTTGIRTYRISVDRYKTGDKNIVVDNVNNTISLSKDINLGNTGSITIGDTYITSNNITLGDPGDPNKQLTINVSGDKRTIGNLTPGTEENHAATVGQTVSEVVSSTPLLISVDKQVDPNDGSKIFRVGLAISLDQGTFVMPGDNINIATYKSGDITVSKISLAPKVQMKNDDAYIFVGDTTGHGVSGTVITSGEVYVRNASNDRTTINADGLTINNKKYITKDGINANNTIITNVMSGEQDTDAVNVSQLKNAIKDAISADTYYGDNKNIFITEGNVITLSQDLDLGDNGSISFGSGDTYITDNSVNVGDTHITSNNITLGGGTTVISKDGAKFGDLVIEGNKIKNVTVGTQSEDVATVGQTVSEVKEGSSNVHVEESRATDGSKIYTVSVDEYTGGSDGNIVVDNTNHTISLSTDINLGGDGSVTIGDTHITSNNITLGGGTTVISKDGAKFGDLVIEGNKIKNVTVGTQSGDVATVGQTVSEVKEGSSNVHVEESRAADGSKIYTVSVDRYKTGDGSIVIDNTNNTISLSKDINLGNDGSIKFGSGDTYITGGGVTVNNIVISNDNRIHGIEAGVESKDAVNLEQMNEAIAGNKVKSGKNITVSGDNTVNLNDNVVLSDKGSLTIGENTTIKDGEITVGGITISSADNQIHGLAPGTNAADAAVVGQTVSRVEEKNEEGVKGLSVWQGADAEDGSKVYMVGLSKDIDLGGDGSITIGDTNITGDNITIGDTIISGDGAKFGDLVIEGNKITNVTAGKTSTDVAVVGQTVSEVVAGKNVTVTRSTSADGSRVYTVSSTGGLNYKAGNNIEINDDTISVKNNLNLGDNGSINVGGITINNSGIDAGGKKITNVADGSIAQGSKDAVNGGQLWDAYRRMDGLTDDINAVGAHAAAMASLHPVPFNPYEPTTISAALGFYRSDQAVALGIFHYIRDDILVNVGGSFNVNGHGDAMFGAGVSFAVGSGNKRRNTTLGYDVVEMRHTLAGVLKQMEDLKVKDKEKDKIIEENRKTIEDNKKTMEENMKLIQELKKALDEKNAK